MKTIILSTILGLLLMSGVSAQITLSDNMYRVYDGKGNPSDLTGVVKAMAAADVVFLGEEHDDAVGHAIEFEVFKRALSEYGSRRRVALSMEMFERDVQIVLDEYLRGQITEQHFLASSRPWGNYQTDYRPMVELAKEKKLDVIAANAPRRYVNMVSRNGRESLNGLSKQAKAWLAPLPYNEPSAVYTKKFNDLMATSGDPSAANPHHPIIYSQALWDATMANSIAKYLKKNKGALDIHLNGGFHTEGRLGTVEQLMKYHPKTRAIVVTIRYEENFNTFDKSKHTGLGDFVILTDAKQPRSKR
jgi:uncharacterized iron-regulated protein